MPKTWELLTWPFRALARLVKLLIVPGGIGALTGWLWTLCDATWLLVITIVCGVWAVAMVYLWWLQIMGRLHSLDRGAIRVARSGRGEH